MNKGIYILVGVAVLAGLLGYIFSNTDSVSTSPPEDEPIACTAEARECPDGSFVAREGPDCSFSACPPVAVALGETVDFGSTSITPQRIVEDSRCPQEVECVWEGTILVEVAIESAERRETRQLSVGDRISTGLGLVVLENVTPRPTEDASTPAKEYRLVFVEDH